MAKVYIDTVRTVRNGSRSRTHYIRFLNTDSNIAVDFKVTIDKNPFRRGGYRNGKINYTEAKVLYSRTILLDKQSVYSKHGDSIDLYRNRVYRQAVNQLAKFLTGTGVRRETVKQKVLNYCIPRTA